MTLYLYADETEFHNKNLHAIGVGLIITREKIDNCLIKKALNDLKNDPDILQEHCRLKDSRTLQRGYFHASEDSKNAHSHLCRAIRQNLNFTFKCFYFFNQNDSVSRYQKFALEIAYLTLAARETEEIIFTIESRDDFNNSHQDMWIEKIYKTLEHSIYDIPFLKVFFPKVQIIFSNKENSGLQVTDFVLWSVNRFNFLKKNHSNTWLERLGIKNHSNSIYRNNNNVDETMSQTYLLGTIDINPIRSSSYPFSDNNAINKNFYDLILSKKYDFYIRTEQSLKSLRNSEFPINSHQLGENLKKLLNDLNTVNNSDKLIQRVASNYLRIFDNLPIYKQENSEAEWLDLLVCRKLFAFILTPEGFCLCQHLTAYRQDIISRNPGILDP